MGTIISKPGSGGGGGGTATPETIYFLNYSVLASPYRQFSSTPTSTGQLITTYSILGAWAAPNNKGNFSFITPFGTPSTTKIPSGTWTFSLWFRKQAGTATGNCIIGATVWKRSTTGVETLIFTSSTTNATLTSTITLFTCGGTFPETVLLPTDRIMVRITVENTDPAPHPGSNMTVELISEGTDYYSSITTTLNQTVPALKTLNNTVLEGTGNISITPSRIRDVRVLGTYGYYSWEPLTNAVINVGDLLTGLNAPIDISLLVESPSSNLILRMYLSSSPTAVAAGSQQIGQATLGPGTIRVGKFVRTLHAKYEIAYSGEETDYISYNVVYINCNDISDASSVSGVTTTANYQYNDYYAGTQTIKKYLLIQIPNGLWAWNLNVESGT
jgi:hypothetical protein